MEFGQNSVNVIIEYDIVSSEEFKLDYIITVPMKNSQFKNYFNGFQISNILIASSQNKYLEIELSNCVFQDKKYICKPSVIVFEKLNVRKMIKNKLYNIYIDSYIMRELEPGIYFYVFSEETFGEILCNHSDFIDYVDLLYSGIIMIKKNCMIKVKNNVFLNNKAKSSLDFNTKKIEKVLSFDDEINNDLSDYVDVVLFKQPLLDLKEVSNSPFFYKVDNKKMIHEHNQLISSTETTNIYFTIILVWLLLLSIFVFIIVIYILK